MTSTTENDARFEAHIGPVREALARLLDAAKADEDKWGALPAADSRAMMEVATEKDFEGGEGWGVDPVRNAHNHAQLLLFASQECARGVVALLARDNKTPVYSHVVLARGALEQAGLALTLLDPSISVRLRIARGMNERLYSFSQVDQLPVSAAEKHKSRERRKSLLREADRLGFRRVTERRQPTTLEESRPSQTKIVRGLFQSRSDAKFGKMLYGYYSAIAHGTAYGLGQHLSFEDVPGKPKTPGVTWAALVTRSIDVVAVLSSLILGVGKAYTARNELFGWTSETWIAAVQHAHTTAKRALPDPEQEGR